MFGILGSGSKSVGGLSLWVEGAYSVQFAVCGYVMFVARVCCRASGKMAKSQSAEFKEFSYHNMTRANLRSASEASNHVLYGLKKITSTILGGALL